MTTTTFDPAKTAAEATRDHRDPLSTVVFEALGAVSDCWDNLPGAGVFESERARDIGDRLVEHLRPTSPTSTGTTVTVEERHGDSVVICDNPGAPDDMRHCEVGRIIDGSFQPASFCEFGLRPEVLRIVAGLVEGATR